MQDAVRRTSWPIALTITPFPVHCITLPLHCLCHYSHPKVLHYLPITLQKITLTCLCHYSLPITLQYIAIPSHYIAVHCISFPLHYITLLVPLLPSQCHCPSSHALRGPTIVPHHHYHKHSTCPMDQQKSFPGSDVTFSLIHHRIDFNCRSLSRPN